jgi:hypothetical protein
MSPSPPPKPTLANAAPVMSTALLKSQPLTCVQTLFVQIPPRQSAGTVQAPPVAQPGHIPPPQSWPVSLPFFTLSLHVGAWQTLPVQTPLGQFAPVTHWTQALAPLQNAPPIWLHAVPEAVGGLDGVPAVQTLFVH